MNKTEAIKELELIKAQIEWEYPLEYQIAFDMAIKALEQEPYEDKCTETHVCDCISRSAEPKWILVTERLPDKFIDCLITVKTDLGGLYTCISRWSSFSGKQEFTAFGLPKECFINNSKCMIYQPVPEGNVIAWMPLPEPYEESDGE
jgi:hypothetical protein